jgi:hypothetical protein
MPKRGSCIKTMKRISFMRTSLLLIAFSFSITSVSTANEASNLQCIVMETESEFFISNYYFNDNYSLAELNDQRDCKISNASLSEDYCIIQNNHNGTFPWITPYVVRNIKCIPGTSPVWESLHTYDSAVPIHLLKESFLI